MSATMTQSRGWLPDCSDAEKAAKGIAKFPGHSNFATAKIVARNEIMAYVSAVSGLEVVGRQLE